MAEALGAGWAHVQHGMDRLIGWGFERMRQAGTATPQKQNRSRAARVGRGILRFVGRAGDAYYRTYDALKQKK